MSKENTFVLRGKLVRKPKPGASYFGTREKITAVLLDTMVGDEVMFEAVGDVKLEDDKFDVPVRMNRHVFSGIKSGRERERKIIEVGLKLEEVFGLGKFYNDPTIDEKIKMWELEGIIRSEERRVGKECR